MPAAALPADEELRLGRLQALAVLDTAAEPLFDALVQAAAAATGRPIALISLIDVGRQWFKASVGLAGVSETPRDSASSAHTVPDAELMKVAGAPMWNARPRRGGSRWNWVSRAGWPGHSGTSLCAGAWSRRRRRVFDVSASCSSTAMARPAPTIMRARCCRSIRRRIARLAK
jgi:hypothetical protein